MSIVYLTERPPVNINLKTTWRLIACCPTRVWIRPEACFGKSGYCNKRDCWVYLDHAAKHYHEASSARIRCEDCDGKGFTQYLTFDTRGATYWATYGLTGTVGKLKCLICDGKGFKGGDVQWKCNYCSKHCTKN